MSLNWSLNPELLSIAEKHWRSGQGWSWWWCRGSHWILWIHGFWERGAFVRNQWRHLWVFLMSLLLVLIRAKGYQKNTDVFSDLEISWISWGCRCWCCRRPRSSLAPWLVCKFPCVRFLRTWRTCSTGKSAVSCESCYAMRHVSLSQAVNIKQVWETAWKWKGLRKTIQGCLTASGEWGGWDSCREWMVFGSVGKIAQTRTKHPAPARVNLEANAANDFTRLR